MIVLSRSSDQKGVKIKVVGLDDMWHLHIILSAGTLVTSYTQRKIKKSFGEREEVSKVSLLLTIRVEKTEYQEFSETLRISGVITECQEVEGISHGDHHTINAEIGSILTIEKEGGLSVIDEDRIRKSKERQPKVLVLLLDRDEALFSVFGPSGVSFPLENNFSLPPKGRSKEYEKKVEENFGSLSTALFSILERGVDSLVIGGPGNFKENFIDFTRGKIPSSIPVDVFNTSSATKSALHELLEENGSKILEKTVSSKEARFMEKLLSGIAKGGAVSYGKDETFEAVKLGAVETLAVTFSLVQHALADGSFPILEAIMRKVEEHGGKVELFSSEGSVEQLKGLGGIAATLRYRMK